MDDGEKPGFRENCGTEILRCAGDVRGSADGLSPTAPESRLESAGKEFVLVSRSANLNSRLGVDAEDEERCVPDEEDENEESKALLLEFGVLWLGEGTARDARETGEEWVEGKLEDSERGVETVDDAIPDEGVDKEDIVEVESDDGMAQPQQRHEENSKNPITLLAQMSAAAARRNTRNHGMWCQCVMVSNPGSQAQARRVICTRLALQLQPKREQYFSRLPVVHVQLAAGYYTFLKFCRQ